MPRKKTILQQLKSSIGEAKAEKDVVLQEELQQITAAIQQPWTNTLRALSKLLQQANSHVTKHYIAEIFGEANDLKVLKPLMHAALAPENENYNASYFWACSKYDCSAYISFFVKYLLKSQDPGESMLACVTVIEEMQGPFETDTINRSITKLLQRNRGIIPTELQGMDELFTVQAAYALLDKYFDQIDAIWKSENPFHQNATRLINERRT